jgi:hypothetical protein
VSNNATIALKNIGSRSLSSANQAMLFSVFLCDEDVNKCVRVARRNPEMDPQNPQKKISWKASKLVLGMKE